MNEPSLSIVIPTCGRPSLYVTLHSIITALCREDDQVIVVGDGEQPEAQRIAASFVNRIPLVYTETELTKDHGAVQRTAGTTRATKDVILYMDDDDAYTPRCFPIIRNAVSENPGKVLMFRMRAAARRLSYDLLWREPKLGVGNLGTPMFVLPNDGKAFPPWPPGTCADFGYVSEIVRRRGGESCIVWREEVIADILR